MAVPKKRTGKSAQAKRRANWKAIVPAVTKCTKCGAVVPTHTVCPECGSYKGRVVSIKNENYKAPEEETKKEEKTKKTSTKKKKEEISQTAEVTVKEENKETENAAGDADIKAEAAKENSAE
ncbi:MAG: 50S ribosomal protein L32 [Candidatus Gastranaerophilales bacterium]|nr:50S ribosomal protein L32 [Candidatus Gastranaerophilales bacterium]